MAESYSINRERLLQTFLDLVQIDSPSGEEDAVAREVARRLETLGATTERDAFGNLIARLAGEGKPILLGTHLDTVEPGRGIRPIIDGDLVHTDGSTVLGGDPKAGLAAIIEGLTRTVESGLPHGAVEMVFSRYEESGLEGSQNLDYSLLTAKMGVEFDGEGPVSKVTVAAPARARVDVTFKGRGAHAGVEPEKGLSAIQMAAKFIESYPQGRLDGESTGNIGLIEGGTAINAVPETARVRAEVRSRNGETYQALKAEIQVLVAQVEAAFPDGEVDLEIEDMFGGYRLPQDAGAIALVAAAIRNIGLEPEFIASGGATDANNMAVHGIEMAVVGLGGFDFHTVRESLSIQNMVDAARCCVALLSHPESGT
jgi:tripeptide aminopeptidase